MDQTWIIYDPHMVHIWHMIMTVRCESIAKTLQISRDLAHWHVIIMWSIVSIAGAWCSRFNLRLLDVYKFSVYYRILLNIQVYFNRSGTVLEFSDSPRFSSQKPERRWFVFGIMCQQDPYLEYYVNEDCIFSSPPINIVFLDSCKLVTRNQKTNNYSNVFTLVLRERQLSLMAQSRCGNIYCASMIQFSKRLMVAVITGASPWRGQC